MVAPPSLKKKTPMKLLRQLLMKWFRRPECTTSPRGRGGQMHNTVSQAIKIDQANSDSSMCFIRQARGVKALSPK